MPGQGQNSSFHDNTFRGNVASQDGGAYWWRLDPDDPSGENFSVFFNTVVGNKAAGVGGGGYIVQHGVLRVDGELYEGNSIDPTVGTPALLDHHGGGLYAEVDGSSILRHNTFKSNSIIASLTGHDYGGGGLAMIGTADISSEFGRFEGNTVAGQPGSYAVRDRGRRAVLRQRRTLVGIPRRHRGELRRATAARAAASTPARQPGPRRSSWPRSRWRATRSAAGGQFAGIAGDPQDDLVLWNSIVYTGGAGDIGGFDSLRRPVQRRMHVRRPALHGRDGGATSARTRSSSAAQTSTRRR